MGSREIERARVELEDAGEPPGKGLVTAGELSSAVAHDINNVLQAAVAATAMACDVHVPREQALRSLRRAEEVAMRGGQLLHRVAGAFGRAHDGPRRLAVDATLRATETLLRPLLGERISLVFDLRAPDVWVRATHAELDQIVLNLASNGRDAMPDGGVLTVRTERGIDGAPHVRILVTDTGSGMDDATKARIFAPFFTTKAPGRGTGLGLSNVVDVVKALGGEVGVESRPGHGTTMSITLPACPPELPTSAADATGTKRLRGTVLLVEDDLLVRTALRRRLEQAGLTVLEAGDVERAWECVRPRDRALDAVVVDVLLPRSTGPELVRDLRRRWPGLPVVYVSGHPGDALDPSTLGARTRLLRKPFAPRDLLREVEALLEVQELRAWSGVPLARGRRDGDLRTDH